MLATMEMKQLRVSMVILGALLAAAAFVAGCGDGDQPAYCSNVSELEESVGEIGDVKLETGAIATLQDDLQTVQRNANEVVSSAKEDFPNETDAVKSAVSDLSTTVEQLPPSPTAQQLLPLASGVSAVVTASKDLVSAAQSACD
jgi:methyl-accepting chemotaxis protein